MLHRDRRLRPTLSRDKSSPPLPLSWNAVQIHPDLMILRWQGAPFLWLDSPNSILLSFSCPDQIRYYSISITPVPLAGFQICARNSCLRSSRCAENVTYLCILVNTIVPVNTMVLEERATWDMAGSVTSVPVNTMVPT
jgi:hypothetical protein